MKNLVMFAKAVGDTTRWRILRLVGDRAMCVCELADILGLPQSTVSSHVQIIRRAGLLDSEKAGKWTYFRVSRERTEIIRTLDTLFGGSADATAKKDFAKRTARLAERAASCCPAPQKLNLDHTP